MQCPPWPLSVDRLEAGPKRQAGPNATVCRAAHSKMQLSYSAWNHMEGLKLQVGGWLDSNKHQSKTVILFQRAMWRKDKKEEEAFSG